ncbi:hypothetical protein [Rhizobacter sp. P5_C2]
MLAASIAGFSSSDLRASLRLADALPTSLEGEDLILIGVVASLPDHTPSALQFASRSLKPVGVANWSPCRRSSCLAGTKADTMRER